MSYHQEKENKMSMRQKLNTISTTGVSNETSNNPRLGQQASEFFSSYIWSHRRSGSIFKLKQFIFWEKLSLSLGDSWCWCYIVSESSNSFLRWTYKCWLPQFEYLVCTYGMHHPSLWWLQACNGHTKILCYERNFWSNSPARPKNLGNLRYAVSILQMLAASHLPFEIIECRHARKEKKRRVIKSEKHQSMQVLQEILCFLQGGKMMSAEKIQKDLCAKCVGRWWPHQP